MTTTSGPTLFRPSAGLGELLQAAFLARLGTGAATLTAFVLVDIGTTAELALRASVFIDVDDRRWRVVAVGCANEAAWPGVRPRLAEDLATAAITAGVGSVGAATRDVRCSELVASMPGRTLVSGSTTMVHL